MKPYLKAQAVRLTPSQDRRVKYTDVDREDVLARVKAGESQRAIARDTGISRRLISFWLHPERLAIVKKQYKARGQSHTSYLKEKGDKWNARQRELKTRKARLYGIKPRK